MKENSPIAVLHSNVLPPFPLNSLRTNPYFSPLHFPFHLTGKEARQQYGDTVMVVARVKKIGATIWDHKKKSIVAGIALYYAGRWVQRWDKNNRIRTAYALEASEFGKQVMSAEDRPRRLMVLANVHAKERGCYDDFVTNALPLFHLAGIETNIIKSDSESQLESLAGAVDKEEADAVYVVGGDGTIGRVITGIFRNHEEAILPIGAYPGGYDNLTLKRLMPSVFEEEADIRRQCESAMALIEDVKKPLKAFKVQVEGSDDAPLYSIGDVGAGWFRHIEDKRKKMWYFGGFKRRWAYIWEMIKRSPVDLECGVKWEEYCPGCSRCRAAVIIEPPQWRWWHILTGTPRYVQPIPKKDYSSVVNERCGLFDSAEMKGSELLIEQEQAGDEEDSARLRMRVGGTDAGRFGVMREGMSRIANNVVNRSVRDDFYTSDVLARAFLVEFKSIPEFVRKVLVSSDELKVEELEGKSVRIETTHKTIPFFMPTRLRVDSSLV